VSTVGCDATTVASDTASTTFTCGYVGGRHGQQVGCRQARLDGPDGDVHDAAADVRDVPARRVGARDRDRCDLRSGHAAPAGSDGHQHARDVPVDGQRLRPGRQSLDQDLRLQGGDPTCNGLTPTPGSGVSGPENARTSRCSATRASPANKSGRSSPARRSRRPRFRRISGGALGPGSVRVAVILVDGVEGSARRTGGRQASVRPGALRSGVPPAVPGRGRATGAASPAGGEERSGAQAR
jgi:hypothetical protein